MSKRTRLAAIGATILAVAAIASGGAVAATSTGTSTQTFTYQDSGTIFASINNTNAKGTEFTSGNMFSRHFGHVAITYDLKVLPSNVPGVIRVTATNVVLYTRRGSLSGTGSATLTISGSQQTVSNGRLVLDQGVGSLKGFTYEGTFTGSANLQANVIRFDFKTILAN
jgi:hypothetical protein